ncbi:unnamed protein product [Sphagnum compactum]
MRRKIGSLMHIAWHVCTSSCSSSPCRQAASNSPPLIFLTRGYVETAPSPLLSRQRKRAIRSSDRKISSRFAGAPGFIRKPLPIASLYATLQAAAASPYTQDAVATACRLVQNRQIPGQRNPSGCRDVKGMQGRMPHRAQEFL